VARAARAHGWWPELHEAGADDVWAGLPPPPPPPCGNLQATRAACRGVQIVTVVPDSENMFQLRFTAEAKELFGSPEFNDKPLLIVSLNGLSGSGKSTLLNMLLPVLGAKMMPGDGFETAGAASTVSSTHACGGSSDCNLCSPG